MNDAFFELPDAAQRLVRQIEATVAEADPLLDAVGIPPDIAFALRETRARYLPDTIAAYLAVPGSQRTLPGETGRSAQEQLLEALSVLDRATRRQLERLADEKRTELAVNARFLSKRFDDPSSAISPISETQTPSPLRAWLPAGTADAKAIVAFVSKKFTDVFPRFTEVRRNGILGTGAIEALFITLPQGGGSAFRYIMGAKDGMLEVSVAKLVHGTTIQTVACPVDDWLESLHDDLEAQAKHHIEIRNALKRLLE
ncbi:MAG: hypothetical protein M3126_05155 [Candidatus Eremiobacteraeota bacterium]|nr:hypothetical protein [Candidatus Eremiobacteraeota bacterium]